jgi:hypothetical protein
MRCEVRANAYNLLPSVTAETGPPHRTHCSRLTEALTEVRQFPEKDRGNPLPPAEKSTQLPAIYTFIPTSTFTSSVHLIALIGKLMVKHFIFLLMGKESTIPKYTT